MMKVNKLVQIILTILLMICLILAVVSETGKEIESEWTSFQLNYQDSGQERSGAERGLFHACYYSLKESGNVIAEGREGFSEEYPDCQLIRLLVDLSDFSYDAQYAMGKISDAEYQGHENDYRPISEDALNALEETASSYRSKGITIVIRFAYDGYEGIADCEPSWDGIKYHLNQLKPFFQNNSDILIAVESGILGRWGEQNGSDLDYSEIIPKLVSEYMEIVPEPISILVRRPLFYTYCTGENYDGSAPIQASVAGTDAYRIGIYNDGYLGSHSDLGTYLDRDLELDWMNDQCAHTAYGGETTPRDSGDVDYPDLTDGAYLIQEMFETHTTYLSAEYYYENIQKWADTNYNGEDSAYQNQSQLRYIQDHLGYRFLLANSQYQLVRDSMGEIKQIRFQFSINNVGAGNLLKDKNVELIIVYPDGSVSEVETHIDPKDWISEETVTEVLQPDQIDLQQKGSYQFYLKVSDSLTNIQFANDNLFSADYGNLIGTLSINQNSSES